MLDFLKLPELRNLSSLALCSTTYRDPLLEGLAAAGALSRLRSVDLSGSINFSPSGFAKYLLSEQAGQLEEVNLSGTEVSDELMSLLARKSALSGRVRKLGLSCCYALTDKGVRELLRAEVFTRVKELDLSRNNLSNDSLFVLSEVTTRELTHLNLSKCTKMNDLGLEKLLNSENVRSLQLLDLSATGIRASPFLLLTAAKHTQALRTLTLADCPHLEEHALLHYLGSPRIALLQHLDLSRTSVGERTVEALKLNPHLAHRLLRVSL